MSDINSLYSSLFMSALNQNNNITNNSGTTYSASDSDFELSFLQMLKQSAPAYEKILDKSQDEDSSSFKLLHDSDITYNDALTAFAQLSTSTRTLPASTTELLFSILNGNDTDELLDYSNLDNISGLTSFNELLSNNDEDNAKLTSYLALMSVLSRNKLL